MSELVKPILTKSLSVDQRHVKLTKAQKSLLSLITDAIQNNEVLTFEKIVKFYRDNVRKTYSVGVGWYYPEGSRYGRYKEYEEFDFYDSFLKGDLKYGNRNAVRYWFTQNIGSLVLKNKLMVIPVIEEF